MGGGSPKGLVHNLLVQLFTLGSSKIEVFETCFFDTVITQNDHPRYVKHILAGIHVVSTLFWVCVARGRFSARLDLPKAIEFLQNHLAEVVRSKPSRRIYGENATYPPILAFLGLFAYPTPRG